MIGNALNSEQPTKKIHGQHGHSDAENNSGKRTFPTPFAESEREPSHYDGHERQSLGNRSGERRLEHVHGVLPWRIPLGLCGASHEQCEQKHNNASQESGLNLLPAKHPHPRHESSELANTWVTIV
jgi:hypothetical protein